MGCAFWLFLGQSPAPLRNIEIIRQLKDDPNFEFSSNAISRMLSALLAEGYVRKVEGNRWATAAKVMNLAKQFADKF